MVGCSDMCFVAVTCGWLQRPVLVCSDVWLVAVTFARCSDVWLVAVTCWLYWSVAVRCTWLRENVTLVALVAVA